MAEWQKRVSEYKERLVGINRITKVVKGGRRFGFAALVVVGNEKGSIGVGTGKSKQVPNAIKKATQDATRNLVKISLKDGRTLHHDVKGRNGSGKVIMRSAPAGTGRSSGVGQARFGQQRHGGRRHGLVSFPVDAKWEDAIYDVIDGKGGNDTVLIFDNRDNYEISS